MSNNYKLIGFTGYAKSGKDTAVAIAQEFGYKRLAFADILKQQVYEINPIVNYSVNNYGYLKALVDNRGWDEIKKIPHVRSILQSHGQKCRDFFGEDIWVKALELNNKELFQNPDNIPVAISDIRYLNEDRWVRDKKGLVIRIIRPGVDPMNNHRSETELDLIEPDYIIHNDKSLEHFRNRVFDLIDGIL